MRNITRFIACSAGLSLLAGVALAQNPTSTRRLPAMRGAVQDSARRPLEGAQIQIMGLDRVVTTGASGGYRFDDIKPGKYWVAVRRIGYEPLRTALTFNPGDDREIDFELEPLAHILPEVKVMAENKAWNRKYQDFIWRSRRGFGHFLTRDDLERAHATYLSDVVRRYLPFVNSEAFFRPAPPDPIGLNARMGLFEGSSLWGLRQREDCAPAVSINGARPLGGWAVNDFRPDAVEAIEVYRNMGQIPIEFDGWGLRCGLVVVWVEF